VLWSPPPQPAIRAWGGRRPSRRGGWRRCGRGRQIAERLFSRHVDVVRAGAGRQRRAEPHHGLAVGFAVTRRSAGVRVHVIAIPGPAFVGPELTRVDGGDKVVDRAMVITGVVYNTDRLFNNTIITYTTAKSEFVCKFSTSFKAIGRNGVCCHAQILLFYSCYSHMRY